MTKTKPYKPGKVAEAVPVTDTVTDGKFQAGDRVRLAHAVSVWGGGGPLGAVDTGTIRSVKRQGDYEYAVVATEPYWAIVMPGTRTLEKLAKEPEKAG